MTKADTNTLVLTGWGPHDYAYAAALAYRALRKTGVTPDILGSSKRRLSEYLLDQDKYEHIFILGISLQGDSEQLMKALAKQKDRGTAVVWISALDVPPEIPGEHLKDLIQFVQGADIMEAVSKYFAYEDSYDDLDDSVKGQDCFDVINAAMYYYRIFQDEHSYGNVIRRIAVEKNAFMMNDNDKKMVKHYKQYGPRELIGNSDFMVNLREQIKCAAKHRDARVMILGESGTGKENIAQEIHFRSPRANQKFISFNCASVAPNLLESRFFGYEKGAFSGATKRTEGLFVAADKGTLFLDEIGELPKDAQALLLRVLEVGRFMRVGGTEEISVDVRVITATNRDLPTMVREDSFRKDLFFRLCVFNINVEPLRNRLSDVEQIANQMWFNLRGNWLSEEQLNALKGYDYPGNVRELKYILEKADAYDTADFADLIQEQKEFTKRIMKDGDMPNQDVPKLDEHANDTVGTTNQVNNDNLKIVVLKHVEQVFHKCGGNQSLTAEKLGVTRGTVKNNLDKLEKMKKEGKM